MEEHNHPQVLHFPFVWVNSRISSLFGTLPPVFVVQWTIPVSLDVPRNFTNHFWETLRFYFVRNNSGKCLVIENSVHQFSIQAIRKISKSNSLNSKVVEKISPILRPNRDYRLDIACETFLLTIQYLNCRSHFSYWEQTEAIRNSLKNRVIVK